MADNPCDIRNFQERDIDLLLAEELRTNPEFAAWFAGRAAPGTPIEAPAFRTRVSVVEDGSESDVIACFRRPDGGVHRVFVEDKIDATMMPEQLERYLRRARAELGRGECAGCSVVLFAPAAYGSNPPEGVVRLTFEEAADALDRVRDCRHSAYKAAFLRAAAAKLHHAAAQNPDVEPYVIEWWDAVYAMLDREFPGYFEPPTTRYPRSVFFAPRTAGMARYLRVDFKGHAGEVDLAVKNVARADLVRALAGLDVPGQVVENGKSSAIRIAGLEKFVIADGFDVIETRVRAAYAATVGLLEFWRANRARFDRLAP